MAHLLMVSGSVSWLQRVVRSMALLLGVSALLACCWPGGAAAETGARSSYQGALDNDKASPPCPFADCIASAALAPALGEALQNGAAVATDVDDTLIASGGWMIGSKFLGGVDTRYPRGTPYPGIPTLQFLLSRGPDGAPGTGGAGAAASPTADSQRRPYPLLLVTARPNLRQFRPPQLYEHVAAICMHGAKQATSNPNVTWTVGGENHVDIKDVISEAALGRSKLSFLLDRFSRVGTPGAATGRSDAMVFFFGDSHYKDLETALGAAANGGGFAAGFIDLVDSTSDPALAVLRLEPEEKLFEDVRRFAIEFEGRYVEAVQVAAYVYGSSSGPWGSDTEGSCEGLTAEELFSVDAAVPATAPGSELRVAIRLDDDSGLERPGVPVVPYRTAVSAAAQAMVLGFISPQDAARVAKTAIQDLRALGPVLHPSRLPALFDHFYDIRALLRLLQRPQRWLVGTAAADVEQLFAALFAFVKRTQQVAGNLQSTAQCIAEWNKRIQGATVESLNLEEVAAPLISFICRLDLQITHWRHAGPEEAEMLALALDSTVRESLSAVTKAFPPPDITVSSDTPVSSLRGGGSAQLSAEGLESHDSCAWNGHAFARSAFVRVYAAMCAKLPLSACSGLTGRLVQEGLLAELVELARWRAAGAREPLFLEGFNFVMLPPWRRPGRYADVHKELESLLGDSDGGGLINKPHPSFPVYGPRNSIKEWELAAHTLEFALRCELFSSGAPDIADSS